MSESPWPDSLRALTEEATGAGLEAAVASRARWREDLARWAREASWDERVRAQETTLARLGEGELAPGELLLLLTSCSELLWPYTEAPRELLPRLTARQHLLVEGLRSASQGDMAADLQRETGEEIARVLARYLKRHPDAWTALVGDVRWTFDGKKVRFNETVELDIKRVVGAGPRALERLDQLRALLATSQKGSRDRVVGLIQNQAIRMGWQDVRGELEERLFQLALVPGNRNAVRTFIACYPEGKKEPGWCARASLLLTQHLGAGGEPSIVESLCELLGLFEHPAVDGLRGALASLVPAVEEAKAAAGARAVADHCWSAMRPDEPGLMLVLLWLEERLFRAGAEQGSRDAFERRNRVREQVRLHPLAEPLCWLAEECAELWSRFVSERRPSADELTGWRQEVSKRFGRKPALRKAAMELFLWCAPDEAASEAELLALSLLRTSADKRNLRRLGEHPSARVRSRVRALQAWLQAGPASAPESAEPATLTSALRHLRAASAVSLGGGRTWLRDRDLEELLFGALSRVERDFSARYPEHFREGGAALVERLLEGLQQEFRTIEADLSALLARGQPAPVTLELRYTRTGNPEPKASGAEIAFVLDVEVADLLRTRRAALVQVGKLEERGEGQWAPSFRLSRERVEAMLARTEAAFCLFLVPPFAREECWLVPARLVRGLMEVQDSVAVVAREGIQRTARSLAQWLLYELIGLWTGDERPSVIEGLRAEGGPAPDFLVELSLRTSRPGR
ncbi:hypothetical protein P2318_19465 [Myxococcaceae bacterium GXIMD 01537]